MGAGGATRYQNSVRKTPKGSGVYFPPRHHTITLAIIAATKYCRVTLPVVGLMKEYRLSSWPELGASYERTAYRRMLSDMSQRHVTLAQLRARSGLARHEVMQFIALLAERGLVVERDATRLLLPVSLAPLGSWLRRALRVKPSTRRA